MLGLMTVTRLGYVESGSSGVLSDWLTMACSFFLLTLLFQLKRDGKGGEMLK